MTSQEFTLKKWALISKTMIAAAVIALTFAFMLHAAPTAHAADFPSQLEETGNYRLQYATGTSSSGKFYWHMMAYNTQTGKMKAYFWDVSAQSWELNFKGASLPELP